MTNIFFYYYATCKCQAPEAWHALNRYASSHGEITFTYVQTQSGIGHERILSVLPPDTIAHMPYIGTENGPLVMVSALTDDAIATIIKQALA